MVHSKTTSLSSATTLSFLVSACPCPKLSLPETLHCSLPHYSDKDSWNRTIPPSLDPSCCSPKTHWTRSSQTHSTQEARSKITPILGLDAAILLATVPASLTGACRPSRLSSGSTFSGPWDDVDLISQLNQSFPLPMSSMSSLSKDLIFEQGIIKHPPGGTG